MASLAAAGYSVALGAFIAGILVSESGEGTRIEPLVLPLRNLFAAIFFIAVGESEGARAAAGRPRRRPGAARPERYMTRETCT